MKSILFVTRRLIIGGIEKALISMLETLPADEFEITVLVMGYGGELEEDVPKHVKVDCLYGSEKTTIEKIVNNLKRKKIRTIFKIAYYTILARNTKSVFQQELYHTKMLPEIRKEFDLAIAYHVPSSLPVVYVINNIQAKLKVAWIHSDVSQYERQIKRYEKFYNKYDKIYCVSKNAKTEFIKIFPYLKSKTYVFYNIIHHKKLIEMSLKKEADTFNDNFDGTRILTIGRLTFEKGYDIIPPILKKLKDEGMKIRWYWIGEGEKSKDFSKKIQDYGLENTLILLGARKNPYPYIKDCDIYVQPSRHEGYCITLAEARTFNKPIITTDFIGAKEQIVNGKTGIIVKFEIEEIYTQLKYILTNPQKLEELKRNLANCSKENPSYLQKLFNIN